MADFGLWTPEACLYAALASAQAHAAYIAALRHESGAK